MPKSEPMPAVSAIASAPQKVTRTVARTTLAPPALAPIAPSTARNTSAAPETIEVEGGFAEVNEAGLTVLAEHIAN